MQGIVDGLDTSEYLIGLTALQQGIDLRDERADIALVDDVLDFL